MRQKVVHLIAVWAAIFMAASCDKPSFDYYGELYGTITDAETKEPVRGAEVVLAPGNKTAVTGNDGGYEFTNLDAKQYKITVSSYGYTTNSRQVTVVSGETVICDMQLRKEEKVDGMELSTTYMDFGTERNEMTFSVKNTGNTGSLDWNISNITASWLSVSPMNGTTASGKSSSVKVTIDRSKISGYTNTTFNVNAAGGSIAVNVVVDKSGTGGGDNTGGGDDNKEDYGSANVESGDSRIIAEIVSCKRSGSTVTLTYTLRNDGLGYINDFRIYTTSSNSLINGAYRTVITDDDYNGYTESNYTFNGVSQSHNYVLTAAFPEGTKCKGTVVVKNFRRESKKLNVVLGIWPYDLYPGSLADPRVYFENVPIY